MISFDVILGMDWLSKYGAVIDCKEKTIQFTKEGNEKLTLTRTDKSVSFPCISNNKAHKLLDKGCFGFLATVIHMTKESPLKLEDMDIVPQYPDVFPDDVPGLPPDRKFKFMIDVVPSPAPISKASYRMAPTKMK